MKMQRKSNIKIGSNIFSKVSLALSFALASIVSVAPSFAQAENNDELFTDSDAVISVLAMMPEGEAPQAEENAGAPGEPRGEHGEGGWHHKNGFHEFMESLTDDQLGQLHALKNNFMDSIGPKWVALKSKERRLHDVMLASTVDGAQAKAIQTDINSLKDEMANLKIDHELAVAKVITPDQRKILRDEMYRHHSWHHGEGHHGGEHHWGM
jgi:Spy/CpxP family protein refolding chaperone